MLYSSEICANTAESSPRIRATLRMTRSVQGKGGPRDFHRHTSFTLAEIQFSSKNVQMAAFAYYKLQNAVRDARLMQLIRITSRH